LAPKAKEKAKDLMPKAKGRRFDAQGQRQGLGTQGQRLDARGHGPTSSLTSNNKFPKMRCKLETVLRWYVNNAITTCRYILPLPADTITPVQQGIFVTCGLCQIQSHTKHSRPRPMTWIARPRPRILA